MYLRNLAKVATSTTGTGTLTLGSAEPSFLTFADAGVADGEIVTYVVESEAGREIGRGVYSLERCRGIRYLIRRIQVLP